MVQAVKKLFRDEVMNNNHGNRLLLVQFRTSKACLIISLRKQT